MAMPPMDTPKEACPAFPSARMRLASRVFRMVAGPPITTAHLA